MCRDCKLLPVCMGGCRVAELGLAPMTQCLPAKSVIPELMEEAYLLMSSRKAGD
jgi:sulfatase maturation enzyme AslB (radical SAM superfamily)